jgi:hypothetical protein
MELNRLKKLAIAGTLSLESLKTSNATRRASDSGVRMPTNKIVPEDRPRDAP